MDKIKKICLAFILGGSLILPCACAKSNSSASNKEKEIWHGSNLFSPYPSHSCYEPLKPDRDDSAGSYMIYRKQLDTYRTCIDTYVRNAKSDISEIESKANSALRQYNNFVRMP